MSRRNLLVVSAPAGSGKTTRLVREYLRCLGRDSVEGVVAITFTRKAASELVERVSRVLGSIAAGRALSEQERQLCGDVVLSPEVAAAALERLPGAPISTVDGFVQALLQEFLLDAALPLPSGGRALLDGPLELETAVDDVYRVAAREALEELGDDAKALLEHASVTEASRDLSVLAQQDSLARISAVKLLAKIGAGITPAAAQAFAGVDEALLKKAGKDAHPSVSAWWAAPSGPPPEGLLMWLSQLSQRMPDAVRVERERVLTAALSPLGLGVAARDIDDCRLEGAWATAGCLKAADALGASLIRLASATRERALQQMAGRGRLGYDEMLLAATELCRSAKDRLGARFSALLVDEVQDTNPAQLAFYRAFSELGDPATFRVVYVGDVRQSIYRFRAADPHGWTPLLDEARAQGTLEELTANHRSTQLLVEVQGRFVKALIASGESGLRELEGLTASRPEQGLLEGTSKPSPVLVVDGPDSTDADRRGIAAFARRLEERWRQFPDETAAVLVPSWRVGRNVVEMLRATHHRAQLWGERSLLESRCAQDARLFLQALLDPSDSISVVGLLKHPSVGVSDAGILALRNGPGLARVLDPKLDLSGLSQADREGLSRAQPELVRARRAIGRAPTAEVLERLFGGLNWRALLAAGPEGLEAIAPGEAIAQLDILLDLVRALEESGTDPCHALEAITPRAERQDDFPPVRLHAAGQTVEVVTVHGAKGLAWDHVAIWGVGVDGGGADIPPRTFTTARLQGKSSLGVKLDPSGGLAAVPDPVSALLALHERSEARAELLRRFYVAFTRARRSVTVAFSRSASKKGSLPFAIREALLPPGGALGPAVALLRAEDVALPPVEPGARAQTGRAREFEARWAEPTGWELAQPTALGDFLEPDVRGEIHERLRAAGRVTLGHGAPKFPELPALREVPENVMGDLVHGWLEAWAFKGAPTAKKAERYLKERWGLEAAASAGLQVRTELSTWLCGVGEAVRDGLPGFSKLLEGKLKFEWPILGRFGAMLMSGRTDLVVEKPDGGLVVVDFKAGPHVATSIDDVPSFNEYALQLESYLRLLRAAGYRVDEVGLLFVRGPSWVRFDVADPAHSAAAAEFRPPVFPSGVEGPGESELSAPQRGGAQQGIEEHPVPPQPAGAQEGIAGHPLPPQPTRTQHAIAGHPLPPQSAGTQHAIAGHPLPPQPAGAQQAIPGHPLPRQPAGAQHAIAGHPLPPQPAGTQHAIAGHPLPPQPAGAQEGIAGHPLPPQPTRTQHAIAGHPLPPQSAGTQHAIAGHPLPPQPTGTQHAIAGHPLPPQPTGTQQAIPGHPLPPQPAGAQQAIPGHPLPRQPAGAHRGAAGTPASRSGAAPRRGPKVAPEQLSLFDDD